jgi:hypothetical protein
MVDNNLANNNTQIFCAVLDLVSKHIQPSENRSSKITEDVLNDIIRNSIKLTNKILSEIKL